MTASRKKGVQQTASLALILAAARSLGALPGANGGLREIRRLMNVTKDPQHKDSPPCPRCETRRTWIVDGRWRCRSCGTRFDAPAVLQSVERGQDAPTINTESVEDK